MLTPSLAQAVAWLQSVVEDIRAKVQSFGPAPPGGAGPKTTFVFRPGATGILGPNVFATWPALAAACAQTDGWKDIGIDVSLAPATIPLGNWQLSKAQDVIIQMLTPPSGAGVTRPTLTIADGATFSIIGGTTTCIKEFQHANIRFSSLATPANELGAVGVSSDLIFRDCGIIDTGTTVAFVETSGANAGKVRLYEGSSAAAGICFNAGGTSTLQIVQDTQSVINPNTLTSAAGATVNVTLGGDAGSFSRTQTGLLGTTTVTLFAALSTMVPNRQTQAQLNDAAVATPAGQIIGGTVDVNPVFNHITLVSQVAAPNTGGKYRVHGTVEVKTSAATTDVSVTVVSKPTAAGNYASSGYSTTSNQGTAAAGGAKITVPFDCIFDGAGVGFAKLLFDTNNSTDVGIQIDVGGGTITTTAARGSFTAEELGG